MSPPLASPKGCFEPGCPNVTHSTYCTSHATKHIKQIERKRGNANQRGYTYRWGKERKAYLLRHPMCVECMEERGVVSAATVVDHITPHKGNMELFWDVTNWQALCKGCHDVKTSKEDGAFGNPIK